MVMRRIKLLIVDDHRLLLEAMRVVRMPGMDGLSVLERLRAQYPSVAVIMLSGIDDPALVRGALDRGAAAFVLKHVDPRDLAAAVRQVVSGAIFRPLDLLGPVK